MKTSDILATLMGKKGQFGRATWKKTLKTRKGVVGKFEKETSMVIRAGINYDNLAVVKEKRESGELPAENQGLPSWQEWDIFPYILRKKDEPDKKYIRLYPTKDSIVTHQYFCDGVEVCLDSIKDKVLASELPKPHNKDCITVLLTNIVYFV